MPGPVLPHAVPPGAPHGGGAPAARPYRSIRTRGGTTTFLPLAPDIRDAGGAGQRAAGGAGGEAGTVRARVFASIAPSSALGDRTVPHTTR